MDFTLIHFHHRSATTHDVMATWYLERAQEIEKLSGEVGFKSVVYKITTF